MGTIDGDGYSIEIDIAPDDPVTGFAFHLRGGESGLFIISDILAELRVRAFAPGSDGGLFNLDRTTEAFSRWRKYRDRVMKPSRPSRP